MRTLTRCADFDENTFIYFYKKKKRWLQKRSPRTSMEHVLWVTYSPVVSCSDLSLTFIPSFFFFFFCRTSYQCFFFARHSVPHPSVLSSTLRLFFRFHTRICSVCPVNQLPLKVLARITSSGNMSVCVPLPNYSHSS